jgi:hypothetical protein
MNDVRLVDFDLQTLSDVVDIVSSRLAHCEAAKQMDERDRLLSFKIQVIYAFSLVKEREKLMSN